MKHLFRLFAVSLSVWLVGCANPGATRPDDSVNRPATERTIATDRTAAPNSAGSVYPAGGLKPLATSPLGSNTVHALLSPIDLWDRIRRGFAMPDLDTDLVRERELWYSSRPDYVARMTERGNKYLFYIVEELERRNMPSELALLPFIESAFNPQAVSSAKAAGMWQFMPATGKDFALKQNMFRDDRRDVIESTRAALDYMQRLYGMFGDWHLALAAYNWGEGSVQRAIKKAKLAGTGTGYTDLAMPMETRMYVPKLQAVKNIVADPDSFRVNLPDVGNHPYFETVNIRRDIDVALVAKLAEISVNDFKALNPSANKPVLLASGTPQILLPWDNAKIFQANLEAFAGGQLASWTAWTAPSTLKATEAARRVGMTESELRAINNIPPRMLIKAGSALLVRRSLGLDVDVSERVADNGQLSLSPEILLRKTTVKAGKKDTVASVAKRFRVSVQSVAEWNQVSATASFKPGQKVVLHLPAKITTGKRLASKSKGQAKALANRKTVPAKKSTRVAQK